MNASPQLQPASVPSAAHCNGVLSLQPQKGGPYVAKPFCGLDAQSRHMPCSPAVLLLYAAASQLAAAAQPGAVQGGAPPAC